MRRLSQITLLVREYDEVIDFYTRALRFQLREDTDMGGGKRWVRIAPSADAQTELLLARAKNDEERACIGNQTGGRVFLFLETEDFAADHAHMLREGVRFTELPRNESYGRVVVLLDLYGNKIDLIERKH